MNRTFDQSRFQIKDRLGRGGTAEVVRVFAPHLNRDAALKYPLDFRHSPARNSPSRSPRTNAHRRSYAFPGLVRILEHENCRQLSVTRTLPRSDAGLDRPFDDVDVACSIISAIALDLEFLRAAGIIHGDFKPQNVFLPVDWRHLNDGHLHWVKFSDFSLGRKPSEDDTRAGLGTIGYIAPETLAETILPISPISLLWVSLPT